MVGDGVARMSSYLFLDLGLRENVTICCVEQTETDIGN